MVLPLLVTFFLIVLSSVGLTRGFEVEVVFVSIPLLARLFPFPFPFPLQQGERRLRDVVGRQTYLKI